MEKEECKYQKIVSSPFGTLYLLKLFNNKVQVLSFKKTDYFHQNGDKSLSIASGEWNYLDAQVLRLENEEQLIITYGKALPIDETV